MKYLLLIYEDESIARARSEQESQELFSAYTSYTHALKEAGVYLGGDALQSVSTATTVRVRGSQTTMTDGPFAETKEQLGGYYLIDAPDLDSALRWASLLPSSKSGSVEVRPLWEYSE